MAVALAPFQPSTGLSEYINGVAELLDETPLHHLKNLVCSYIDRSPQLELHTHFLKEQMAIPAHASIACFSIHVFLHAAERFLSADFLAHERQVVCSMKDGTALEETIPLSVCLQAYRHTVMSGFRRALPLNESECLQAYRHTVWCYAYKNKKLALHENLMDNLYVVLGEDNLCSVNCLK